MVGMAMAKYDTAVGRLSAPDINKKLMKSKSVRYARSIGHHYSSIKPSYTGPDVMLFFYKRGKCSWNALIFTDTEIYARKVFRLYTGRWVIEVAHEEMKGFLNIGN